MKRPQKKFALITFLMIASLLWSDSLLAQSSPAYDLSWFTLTSGDQRQSPNFVIQDAIGQLAAGVSTSNKTKIIGGFVVGEVAQVDEDPTNEDPTDEDQTVFLPIIIR